MNQAITLPAPANLSKEYINFAPYNFSYIVVIAETQKGFDLVTVFFVKETYRKEKFRKEFESFSTKKGVSLIRRTPNFFYTW
jgi:hypothetical protein